MKNTTQILSGVSLKNLGIAGLLGALAPFSLLLFIILTKEEMIELWMFVPLTLIPLGGALGGVFFFLMGFQWFPKGNQKLIAIISSTIIYFLAIWIFAVLAFNSIGQWD